MRPLLPALLALAACTGAAPAPDASGTPDAQPGDSGAAQGEALPELLGLTLADDLDPDPAVLEVELRAAPAEVEWVDGRATEVWAYNGVVPGPVLHARVGDTVRVHLTNDLDQPTTIHWHGLRIDDEMDGVPAIQDPVQPGESFTYEFVLPDSGTFWYHPHHRANEQIEHGLQGMLVVREATDPATEVVERGFVIDDVYLNASGGFGTFNQNHMEQMHGRLGNTLLLNGEARVGEGALRPGVPERWRIVNTANARMMSVEVEGAPWRVIAIDGALLPEPIEVGRFRMPVGRRVDLEVLPERAGDTVTLDIFTAGETYTLFEGAVEGEAGDGAWTAWDAPALPEQLPVEQEVELVLNGQNTTTGLEWTINGATWADHEAIRVAADTPTRLTVRDESGAEHPFHLHGQFFQIVSRDGALQEWDTGLLYTVMIGRDEELVLYTGFENPGRWMAHCHILEHAELGMMTELIAE